MNIYAKRSGIPSSRSHQPPADIARAARATPEITLLISREELKQGRQSMRLSRTLWVSMLGLLATGALAGSRQAAVAARPSYDGTAAAQAAVSAGDSASKLGEVDNAIAYYKKAISLDPNYAAAQKKYIEADSIRYTSRFFGKHDVTAAMFKKYAKALEQLESKDARAQKRLIDQYTNLVAARPESAVYAWALGLLYEDKEDIAHSEALCEKSHKIDKNFAPVYQCLSHNAMLRGDNGKSLEYARARFELEPDDVDAAGMYVDKLILAGEDSDAQIRTLLERFPKSSFIAHELVGRTNGLRPEQARVAALERLLKDAPALSDQVALHVADELYPIYIMSDLPKARDLADEMVKSKGMKKWDAARWAKRLKLSGKLVEASREVDGGRAGMALATLTTVAEQEGEEAQTAISLLQARALDASGRTPEAFALLRKAFIAAPSVSVRARLREYGAKLAMSSKQVDDDVFATWSFQSKAAPGFTLKRLDNGRSVSLSDYRGKVVIVDFWFPDCAPCRASFPYLQQVASTLKPKGLAVLSVNSVKDQVAFALPYLRSNGYDFIGLAGDEKFASSVYGVRGYPSTFLIGADGKIYMRPSIRDEAGVKSTEVAAELLLQEAKSHVIQKGI